VLGELLARYHCNAEWLAKVWTDARATRPSKMPPPADIGPFDPTVLAAHPKYRFAAFERMVPPPADFLRYLIEQPRVVPQPLDDSTRKRLGLYGKRELLVVKRDPTVRREGLEAVQRLQDNPMASFRAWWAFEGFTHVDCCLTTPRVVVFIEGKHTEKVSTKVRWCAERNQLWRNVEAAAQLAAGREFGVILGVETAAAGTAALDEADRTLTSSYPHLSDAEQQRLSRHLLGFVTWPDLVHQFELSESCLIERPPTPAYQRRRRAT